VADRSLAVTRTRCQPRGEAGARGAFEALLQRFPGLRAVIGELVVVALELELTAARHRERVLDRLRYVRERRPNLLGRLHVELVGVELPPPLIGERLAGLDAEQH